MKSNSRNFLLLAVLGALAWAGCETTQYPSSYLSSSGANPAMIVDFEGGLQVNPLLAEANRTNNVVPTPGVIAATGSPLVTPLLVMPGANNTNTCVHMAGTVVDPGNGSYPSVQLVVPLDISGQGRYDASLFTGIKFYLKTAVSDNAGQRTFSIPIVKTSVAPQGTCALYNSCYNGFSYAYNNTGNAWTPVVLTFATMTRGNYGGKITPETLTGTNLQEILSLQWQESNNNVAGTINVDFSVDEVQFF